MRRHRTSFARVCDRPPLPPESLGAFHWVFARRFGHFFGCPRFHLSQDRTDNHGSANDLASQLFFGTFDTSIFHRSSSPTPHPLKTGSCSAICIVRLPDRAGQAASCAVLASFTDRQSGCVEHAPWVRRTRPLAELRLLDHSNGAALAAKSSGTDGHVEATMVTSHQTIERYMGVTNLSSYCQSNVNVLGLI
jgi:hypothetical protein